MARSFLNKGEGIWQPGQRYAFTNISDQPFESKWGGQPIIVGVGETIEVSDSTPFGGTGLGQKLAYKMTNELVDKIMFGMAKAEADEAGKTRGASFYAPSGIAAGIPAQRKQYEEKILRQLHEEEGVVERLTKEKLNEITLDQRKQEGVSYGEQPREFASVPVGGVQGKEQQPKKAVRTKKIKAE